MDDLRLLRLQAGYKTQKAAAAAFEVSKRTWNFWENGRTRTPVTVIELLKTRANPSLTTRRLNVGQSTNASAQTEDTSILSEHAGDILAVRVTDDGFPPHIAKGDIVLVDRDKEIFAGDVGLFTTKNRQMFGRLQSQEGMHQLIGSRGPVSGEFKPIGLIIEVRRFINQ